MASISATRQLPWTNPDLGDTLRTKEIRARGLEQKLAVRNLNIAVSSENIAGLELRHKVLKF